MDEHAVMKRAWFENQTRAFEALVGRHVTGHWGVEMALGGEDEGPIFSDTTVPCLQLIDLVIRFNDDRSVEIGTYQNSLEFGLGIADSVDLPKLQAMDGIFRWRRLYELPTGTITSIALTQGFDFDFAEVDIELTDGRMHLIAGEVQEVVDGYEIHRYDECVLVFLNSDDVNKVAWIPPRD